MTRMGRPKKDNAKRATISWEVLLTMKAFGSSAKARHIL